MNNFAVAAYKWSKIYFYFPGGLLELSFDSTASNRSLRLSVELACKIQISDFKLCNL